MSLRERKDDISPLVVLFLKKFNEKYKQNKSISPDVMEVFTNYDWPGNVRELEHTLEQMMVLCPEEIIGPEHLPDAFSENLLSGKAIQLSNSMPLKDVLENVEKAVILNAIKHADTLNDAAAQLGIDLSTLTRKKQKHGIFRKKCEDAQI